MCSSDMRTVDIPAAKTQLSRLVEAAAKKSLSPNRANRWSPGPLAGLRQKRRLGILAEKLRVPEDFGDPLPDEVIEAFEGR